MKIYIMGAEVFHVDGQADGEKDVQTDGPTAMTKQLVTFRRFENSPTNCDTRQNLALYVPDITTVLYVPDIATVLYVPDIATVLYVSDIATVLYVPDIATVLYVSDIATVLYVPDIATVLQQDDMLR